VRLEASRHSPGTGLGLSLVVAVAKLHDAKLDLADNAPGLRATLLFPHETAIRPALRQIATPAAVPAAAK
jgi:signal transduction histidine kinase